MPKGPGTGRPRGGPKLPRANVRGGRHLVHVEGKHYFIKKGNRFVPATQAQVAANQARGIDTIIQSRGGVILVHNGLGYKYVQNHPRGPGWYPAGGGAGRGRGQAAPTGGMPVFKAPERTLAFEGGDVNVHSKGGGKVIAHGFKPMRGQPGVYVMEEAGQPPVVVRRRRP